MNIAGKLKEGFSEPIWVIRNLQEAMEIYSKWMKIDESFRDIKSFLLFEKIMNKKQINMEKMIALVLLAYTISLLLGEGFLDRMYEGRK